MKQQTSLPFHGKATLMAGLFATILTLSCARQPTPIEQHVAEEVAREEPVKMGAPLKRASNEILFEAESLSPAQKERLSKLHAESAAKAKALKQELSKNHLVLMKSLVNPKTKDDEIEVLKKRILRLEKQQTENFLQSLDDAKRILGRKNSEDEKIYRAFVMDPRRMDLTP